MMIVDNNEIMWKVGNIADDCVIITVITLVVIIRMITWRIRVDHYLQFLVQTCGVAVAPIDRFWHHVVIHHLTTHTSCYHIITISAPSRYHHHHHLGLSQEIFDGVTPVTEAEKGSQHLPLKLITFDSLAAERLRLMRFNNRLIIDYFANVVNILSTSSPDIRNLKNFEVELFAILVYKNEQPMNFAER